MKNPEQNSIMQYGYATLLPGLQFALDRLQAELDHIREMMQGPAEKTRRPAKRREVVQPNRRASGAKSRWANMSFKERKVWQQKMLAGRQKAKKVRTKAAKKVPTVRELRGAA